ncbi:MAG: membrane protein insertion efficiency factor YidD [Gluconacetobacter diazotrophicus]|nr:membrane protein insertion efficiency factor YidD [Gluconacetobacter diazotrophicus]
MLVAIRCYQLVFRPVLGPNCRFHPSCSEYAVEALRRHGAVRGAALASRRILRCNPWHPGGLDPVPVSCSCGDPHRRVLPIPIRD